MVIFLSLEKQAKRHQNVLSNITALGHAYLGANEIFNSEELKRKLKHFYPNFSVIRV